MNNLQHTCGENLYWEAVKKELLYPTPIFSIHSQSALSPKGEKRDFITVDAPEWVITIPVFDKKQAQNTVGIKESCFLLVKQWRAGANELSLEFPGGVINKGETPEKAAERELLEETGFKAENCILLGSMNPNPALFCNTIYFFTTEKLTDTQHKNLDEDEFVSTLIVPAAEVYKKMGQPPYIHALMAAALCLYRQYSEE